MIRRLDVVPWAALAHAVAQADEADDRALRARFGVSPPAVWAIREGLVRQRIALGRDAPPGPWARAGLPPALEKLHARAVRWFGSPRPSTQAACASWMEHFPGIACPGDPAGARRRERAIDWLGPPSAPRHGAFEALRAYLAAEGDMPAWQAMVALAHVRAVALRQVAATNR
jgi:hypothetical protein